MTKKRNDSSREKPLARLERVVIELHDGLREAMHKELGGVRPFVMVLDGLLPHPLVGIAESAFAVAHDEDGRYAVVVGAFLHLGKILLVAYVVVGLIVANSHHYFTHLHGIKPIASAVLAVVLWPLILFGVSLHIK